MLENVRPLGALKRQNRLLLAGYGVIAMLAVAAVAMGAGGNGPQSKSPRVDSNQVGTAQMMVGIDHPDGFAVLIDEDGKVNVVHRDGRVIVNRQKQYN